MISLSSGKFEMESKAKENARVGVAGKAFDGRGFVGWVLWLHQDT